MKIFCPDCGAKLEAGEDIDEPVACPSCGGILDVPALRAATCPVCGCGFEDGDIVRVCPDCKIPHHDECWTENRGCSTYGCTKTVHQETHVSPSGETPLPPAAGTPDIPAPLSTFDASAMAKCPACGAMHPATDLVCVACGKLFDQSPDGSSEASGWKLPLEAGKMPALGNAIVRLFARIFRNLRLIGEESIGLWLAEIVRLADFTGVTSRRRFAAFTGVNAALSAVLLLVCEWARLPAYAIAALAMLLLSASSCVRRLRETDLPPSLAAVFLAIAFVSCCIGAIRFAFLLSDLFMLLLLVPAVAGTRTEEMK